MGAGERALLVAEQLGLDQLARDRRAVDPHERTSRPFREVVQATRHQLLAGARLALNEHRRVRWRDACDLLAKNGHRRARPEQRWGLLGGSELASHPALRHRTAHRQQQVRTIGRLGEVGGSARLENLLRGELVTVARQHDNRDLEAALTEVVDQPQPVHARHLEVEQGGVRLLRVEQVESLERVARLVNGVPGGAEDPTEDRADPGIVVDDQDAAFHAAHGIQSAARMKFLPVNVSGTAGLSGGGGGVERWRSGAERRGEPESIALFSTPLLLHFSTSLAGYTSNLTPWASGSSRLQLMVQVWRRM